MASNGAHRAHADGKRTRAHSRAITGHHGRRACEAHMKTSRTKETTASVTPSRPMPPTKVPSGASHGTPLARCASTSMNPKSHSSAAVFT